ncbi:tetratricopeptide repeat protein [Acidobacteriota bacterium]
MNKEARYNLIIVLLLVTVNLALFLPSMTGGFLWDDKLLITENPSLHDPNFLTHFMVSPFGGHLGLDENSIRLDRLSQFYRPVTSLSYWIDANLWGMNPAAFHLTNILLQILNCIVLYFILSFLGIGRPGSFSASLLFSLYPLHFENVSWISGRTDLLSFLFAALSVLVFIHFLNRKGSRYGYLCLSALFYLLSLLSKENAIFLPVIYLVLILRREQVFKRNLPQLFPFAFSFAVWFVLRRLALATAFFQPSGRSVVDFFSTIGFYSLKILWPFDLSFTIDSGRIFGNPFYITLGIVLILIFLITILLLFKRSFAQEKWGVLFTAFFLGMFPSVLVIFSASTVSFLAWRFLYLPSALFIISLVFLARSHVKWKGVLAGFLILICLSFVFEIYPKNRAFGQREEDFWGSIKKVEKENFLAQFNVALFMLPTNETRSVALFDRILEQKDHHLFDRFQIRIYEELAAYFTSKRILDKAEDYFNRLLQTRDVQSQHFYVTYARFLAFSGRSEEGEKLIRRMLGLFPKNHLILLHSAKFFILIEDYDQALDLLERDFALFPTEEIKALLDQVRTIKNRLPFPDQPPRQPS